MKTKMKTREDFYDLLKKFCMETSIMGLKYFYLYPDRWSRCYWSLILICVITMAGVLTGLLWNRFLEMPTRISIENQYAPVEHIPFPAITVCSPNQITISNVNHFIRTLVDGNHTLNFHKTLPLLLGFFMTIDLSNAAILKELNDLITLNRHHIRNIMISLPLSCEDFIIHCIYKMEVVNCKDFFTPIMTMHGLCCIFNSPYRFTIHKTLEQIEFEPLKPEGSGLYEGLTIVTDYKPDDALDGTLLHAGATKVMFNDWLEYPSNDESMLVYPNMEAFHSIEAAYTYCSEEVAALPVVSRKCVYMDEVQLRHFRQYRNSDCDMECFINKILLSCHCVPFFMPINKKGQICDILTIPCIVKARVDLTNPELESSSCDCPRDCESRRYQVDLHVGNKGSHDTFIFHELYENVTLTKSTTIMHMYFGSPFYTQQKQETVMSLINLMSNLGGVFGLCLGCSVISILEIVFFIYNAICNFRARMKDIHGKKCIKVRSKNPLNVKY